jgi:hypothetical protein
MSVVHCKREAYDVYAGRGCDPRSGEMGVWGNPFSHLPRTRARYRVGSRSEAIAAHRGWLWQQICAGEVSLEELAALAGKVLGCWCAPKACHAETLVCAALWAKRVLEGKAAFDRSSDAPPF